MTVDQIIKLSQGKFFSGEYLKSNQTLRKVWGKIENVRRHKQTITFYDMRKKDYRRISLKNGYLKMKIGNWEITYDKR